MFRNFRRIFFDLLPVTYNLCTKNVLPKHTYFHVTLIDNEISDLGSNQIKFQATTTRIYFFQIQIRIHFKERSFQEYDINNFRQ